jgi:hypothetical protein
MVHGDSESREPKLTKLVEQVEANVSELEARDCEVSFHYVHRALNPHADRLANRAMDEE